MNMESSEFDATLGGAEHLPQSANIFKFAASRSIEIAAMTESVVRPSKSKLIFQSLPVHMRRRVMSHNSKRLPKKLLAGHLEQFIKSGLPPKQKRPSRKYRRRPTNLLEEYNRRKKQHIWLETHIWHAKRFHMVNRWGHRLAYRPCDKAFRACYRASSAHCLLQDISYYTPLRIKGPVEEITKMFDCITNKSCGLSIRAKCYISGNREGTIHLYKPNLYPFGYIGEIKFIWVQISGTNKELWIFVHPSQTDSILSVLNILSAIDSTEPSCTLPKRRKIINDSSKIEITTMTGALNRFRLTGPKSQAVLVECLKCVTSLSNIKHHDWISYYNDKEPLLEQHLKEKHEYWESLCTATSPSQLPPSLVLGLVVKDPRLSRPKHRKKAQSLCGKDISMTTLLKVPSFSSVSPLWADTVRDKILQKKVTNPQYVKHITDTQLIPGEVNEDDPTLQCIPIVLIQSTGSQLSEYKKIGYGSGWDIIIPSGYGLPFWLTFIMFGARSGGLRETENLAFERGKCYFPPDSDAGRLEEKAIETQLKEQYFKRPPSKRVNYITHGISSPFLCPWNILLKDWCDKEVDDFFVLRDKQCLREIQNNLIKRNKLEKMKNGDNCLVATYIHILGKGNLKQHALICMPHPEDMKSKNLLQEPQHVDPCLKLRKQKRKEHKKALKQQRRAKNKLKKGTKPVTKRKSCTTSKPSQYVKEMRDLWLPHEVNTIRYSGVRQTIGYVFKAAYSFSEAKCCGVGYIAYNALVNLLDNGHNQVLVRNTSTLKYRLAKIQVIND